ncbi:MAG: DUF488 domain-containing protein [Nitrospira sp.]|nr:MAG: DUF488 domain-containing protein [Nitrospira sp.]
MSLTIWTIGHSTRALDELRTLLNAHRIQHLVDVRRYPFSRRYPHFNGELLADSLREVGLAYTHAPGLGGRRKARPDFVNLGWRNESFRGYADYMETEEFQRAVEELMAYGTDRRTAIMCAEAVPWRCHRQLIADALVARGWTVRHILGPDRADVHRLTTFAAIDHGQITYPSLPADADSLRLF